VHSRIPTGNGVDLTTWEDGRGREGEERGEGERGEGEKEGRGVDVEGRRTRGN
jgi:hypothetical protein